MAELDHLILTVNDRVESIAFYTRILGFVDEGRDGPFSVLRVSPSFTLQLAQRPTTGGEHYAFAMTPREFDDAFQRLRDAGIPYGDAFNNVGSSRGPGAETGARGPGKTIYFFDPSRHLLEIRCYADMSARDPS
jgi:catechol 2,3-dioxygenase-like lactoylglutathione lyase family enzyme